MRKYILALLLLSGVAAAQSLRVPMLHHDPVDAQRAALHEKLTRLAETRSNLDVPVAQPDSSRELDALTVHVCGGGGHAFAFAATGRRMRCFAGGAASRFGFAEAVSASSSRD